MELEVRETKFDRPHIEEGLYPAVFKGMRDISKGEYGERVALLFDIILPTNGPPVEMALVCYKRLSRQSNLGKALEALGATLEVGARLDTKLLEQTPCRVLVESYTTSDGNIASGIDKVMEADAETAQVVERLKQREPDSSSKAPPFSVTHEHL